MTDDNMKRCHFYRCEKCTEHFIELYWVLMGKTDLMYFCSKECMVKEVKKMERKPLTFCWNEDVN